MASSTHTTDTQPNGISMRLATRGDANNLSALATQVFLHTYATEGVSDDLSAYVLDEFAPSSFERTLAHPSSAILVEEVGGALIAFSELAFGAACPSDPAFSTEVTRLYVQEHFWRKFVGTRLLEGCRRLAHDRVGDPALWLSVYAGNSAAIGFYARNGFKRAGELWFELDSVAHLNFVLVQGQDAD